ncbi:MAG: ribbon-helix-helix protein, CopG family [Thermoplasmata archaeon]|nr:ribbon-helix-helix protein, CopG family [Thermoplasmata archaeon]
MTGKGRKRQKTAEGDRTKRVNVSLKESTLERIDEFAKDKEVSRSYLIGEAVDRMLNDKVSEMRFVGSVTPPSSRFLSKDDRIWMNERIERIKATGEAPDIQEIYVRDLLKYVSNIEDWYTHKDARDLVVQSLKEPYDGRVQSYMLSLLSRAFAFSRRREDEDAWNYLYDKTFPRIREILLARELAPDLLEDLFKNVLAFEILLGYDEATLAEKQFDFLMESLRTFTKQERSRYNMAGILGMVADQSEENARKLKDALLETYTDEGIDDDTKEYVRLLLHSPRFEGL